MTLSKLLLAAAAAATMSTAAQAALVDLDNLSGWDIQDQFGVLGNFYDNTYTTSVGKSVKVTDLYVWGDEYEYFINGVSQGTILAPLPPADYQSDPAIAFTSGLFARTSFYLGAGDVLSFKAITLPDGYSDGTIAVAANVPEAATWAMLIAGFGLVGAAVRRRSAAVAA